jgi:hypothetical protein
VWPAFYRRPESDNPFHFPGQGIDHAAFAFIAPLGAYNWR